MYLCGSPRSGVASFNLQLPSALLQLAGHLVGTELVHIKPDGVWRTACALHVRLVQVTAGTSPATIHQLLILFHLETIAMQSG